MNINSTSSDSTYVNSASGSKGFSGLASGIDTEKMVEAMLANAQGKIDKQNALKQQLLWKQEIYRDVISRVTSFQNKYFGSMSSTNFMSQSFFNTMSAVSTSSAFKATATSSAAIGATKIKVNQLASNTTLTSGGAVSGKLAGTVDAAKLQDLVDQELSAPRTVAFKVGSADVTVDLSDVFVDNNAFSQMSDIDKANAVATKINDAFSNAGFSSVTASVSGNSLSITNTDAGNSVSVDTENSSESGLKALGLTGGKGFSTQGSDQKLTSTMSLNSTFSIDITLDDIKKTVNVNLKDIVDGSNNVVAGDFKAALGTAIGKAHGAGQIELIDTGANSFELQVGAGRKVMVGGSEDSLTALGVKNGQSNKIGMGAALKDLYFTEALQGSQFSFTINDMSFEFNENSTMTEVMNRINASDAGVRLVYKPLEDKFVMEATNSGQGFNIEASQQEGNLLSAMFGSGVGGVTTSGAAAVYVEGKNALVDIDGVITERSSNNFNINGINIELKAVTVGGEYETVDISRGADQIVDGVKSFIKDYNELIDKLNNLIREDSTYKKYDPLTDAQKKEMSDREIELWEEKAKEGLVKNDSTISGLLQELRNTMFVKPEGSSISLYDLGVDTSSDWRDFGKLVLTSDGESRLRQIIESNPDEVIKLFTGENGLSTQLNKAIDKAANSSSAKPGLLVQVAGLKGKATDSNNDIYNRLKYIDEKIAALKRSYETEKSRYWRQFNAMEQMVANMNNQSAWLMSSMGQ